MYGRRYSAAAVSLGVASLVALLNLMNGQLTTVFFGRGMPNLHRTCVVIMAITMMTLIYPSVRYLAVAGGQLSALIAITAGLIFQIVRVRNLTRLHLSEYGKVIAISSLFSMAVATVWCGARALSWTTKPVPSVLFGIAGCLVAYSLGAAFLLRRGAKESAVPADPTSLQIEVLQASAK